MASLTKNFFYMILLISSNYLFPLLIFPYISRVLGVDKIGLCNFIDGIINYFLYIAMIGVGTFGVREIAKHKDSREMLNSVFSNLLVINIIATSIVILLLLLMTFITNRLYENRLLVYIGILKIISTSFLIEWFYKGSENFKYISLRALIIKTLYVCSVFVLIKNEDDYVIYFLLTALLITFNSLFNLIYARKFVSFRLDSLLLKPYIRIGLITMLYTLFNTIHITFNPAFLGLISTNSQVGFYSTSTKILMIILSLFTAFSTVMFPRMTKLLNNNEYAKFRDYVLKSYRGCIIFIIPIIALVTIFSSQLIELIVGSGYEGAINPLKIIISTLPIIVINQIILLQVVIPSNNDRFLLFLSLFGIITCIALNFILVPTFNSIGSSVVWLLTELLIWGVLEYKMRKDFEIRFPFILLFKNILFSIPYIVICIFITTLEFNSLVSIVFGGISTCIIFGIGQIILKEPFFYSLYLKLKIG